MPLQNGTIDLRNHDFRNESVIRLDGMWEFYWKKLYFPEDFRGKRIVGSPDYFMVPSIWNGCLEGGERLTGDGYATLRLSVLLPEAGQCYGFKLPETGSAYRLFADGKLIASNGTVGKDPKEHRPQFLPQMVFFKPASDFMEVIVHISNFSDFDGGCWNSIRFGPENGIIHARNAAIAMDVFVFAVLFIMGFYYLAFYLIRRKELSSLMFGLVCLLMSVRMLMVGERLMIFMFPDFNWEAAIKIEHLTMYLAPLAATAYIYSLFADAMSRYVLYAWCAAAGAATAAVLLFPARIHGIMLDPYQVLILAGMLYLFYVMIVALVRRRDGALLVLTGLVAIIVTATNDILHDNGFIVSSLDMIPLGTFVMVLTNSVALLKRFSTAFTNEEILTRDLRELNSLKDRLLLEHAGSRLKTLQDRFKPHFIYNSIHTLLALVKKDTDAAERAIIMLADMLHYLTDRSFEDAVSFKEEWQFTRNYMEFLKINYHDCLLYEMEAEGDFERIMIPPLTIQPLAENAVKHGIRIDRKDEKIMITARADKNSLRIRVQDNGRGLQTDSPYSRTLGHIRDRLKHHHRNSELLVENNDDGGVTATISIPLEGWAREE